MKKRRGGRPSVTRVEPWLQRTLECFAHLDAPIPPACPPLSMTLRDRSKAATTVGLTPPGPKAVIKKTPPKEKTAVKTELPPVDGDHNQLAGEPRIVQADSGSKKPPRVVLKLGPDPKAEGSSV
jgi:hypothetical protein